MTPITRMHAAMFLYPAVEELETLVTAFCSLKCLRLLRTAKFSTLKTPIRRCRRRECHVFDGQKRRQSASHPREKSAEDSL